jgi:hypothetical protein
MSATAIPRRWDPATASYRPVPTEGVGSAADAALAGPRKTAGADLPGIAGYSRCMPAGAQGLGEQLGERHPRGRPVPHPAGRQQDAEGSLRQRASRGRCHNPRRPHSGRGVRG